VVALELAAQLAQRGATVLCAALDETPGPLIERCRAIGLQVVSLRIPTEGILGRNGISFSLTRRLRELRLDAIHLHHFLALNKLGLAARVARISRIVVTEHSDAQLRDSRAGSFRLRFNWRLAHVITVIHEGLREYLVEEIGIPSRRIQTIRNGIDLAYWNNADRAECRSGLGLTDTFTYAFVGRLAPVKNVPGLISAFLKAYPRLPRQSRLLIVGDGTEMDECRRLQAGHPLGRLVTLAGEQLDTRRYMSAADAFVLNSVSEGSPRALLEAMSVGLPAICPAVGEVPALLGGRGWVTEPGNEASLMSALVAISEDLAAAHEVAMRARQYVSDHYDARTAVAQYETLLCGGHGPE
jgi:glycosyltransferase involved in cell wall biosynthesis